MSTKEADTPFPVIAISRATFHVYVAGFLDSSVESFRS